MEYILYFVSFSYWNSINPSIDLYERGIYGINSKTAPFIDVILSFHFLRVYKVNDVKIYDWTFKILCNSQWRHNEVTKWAILLNFQ